MGGGGLNLNRRARARAAALAERAEALGVERHEVAGAEVLDCGVRAPGGFEAGRLFAEATMAGLGSVTLVPWAEGGLHLPGVQVVTDRPLEACLLAQYAGWALREAGFSAMASGPGRALARVEALFDRYPVAEAPGEALIALEAPALPPPAAVAAIARRCGVEPGALTILVARTASAAGAVQVAARVVETALHKLGVLGLDPARVRAAWGTAPVAPVAADDLTAMGRTNDCLLYGGRVALLVDAPDEDLARLAARLPSGASPDHGRPFAEIFRERGDFYRVDPFLFSPAAVALTSTRTGRTFAAGATDPDLLRRSLFGAAGAG
ncbi:methenyltetrahydromethanopterin cyclohydrolase [Caldinitratiruptor microaerophilus]|uniref:Methenyltetrahydromethanopterin cyclohydrolase n=1 Tax=Caldinitratiruptor microaerophilus TaxID=671077 RepID=A0AA35CMT1_9FIRM|nr:methenyltetrahydromethanopterin cyclohydrolase [Caldinitratiruptor microaerophilus]BDG60462.1 methenyltetrahydromethanopterin cyclohydrolase [Caldinitratiruptor microaerophilus]